jgi:hypothetical protein
MATIFDSSKSATARGNEALLRQSNVNANRSRVGTYNESIFRNQEKAENSATWDTITQNKANETLKQPSTAKTTKTSTSSKPQDKTIAQQRAENLAKPLSPLQQGTLHDWGPVASVVAGSQQPTYKKEYPEDLPMGENSYYLQIMMGPYNVNAAVGGQGVQHDMSIAFPLPANLLTSTSLDYTNINLGAFGGEFFKSALRLGDAANRGDFFAQLRSEVNSGVQQVFDRNDGSVRQLIARRLVSGLSPALGSAIDIASGTTPNPHVAVTFNNVKLRSFTYTWKFSPNRKEESARLQEIIQKLHQRVLPKKQGNLLLEYPNQCQLQFFPNQLNDLFQFKPCVVDSINVNYAPSGTPSFFADSKLPTEIELSMTFHEIQIRTAEDYGAGA